MRLSQKRSPPRRAPKDSETTSRGAYRIAGRPANPPGAVPSLRMTEDRQDADPAPAKPGAAGVDPRAKEATLKRLRDASDEELAVFEAKLREDALRAGASEQDVRDAQAGRPEHG